MNERQSFLIELLKATAPVYTLTQYGGYTQSPNRDDTGVRVEVLRLIEEELRRIAAEQMEN